MPRADLHVHSKYSNRPTNFFLKQMKAPESLTEPEAAYRLAKRRGMDFVTLTDLDTLDGCHALAHYSDVIPGCETTLAFPEDECMIRLLIFGLNDAQLERIKSFRGNVYQVRDYLLAENLFHVVATPLEILNLRLSPDHIERMLLLFDHYEAVSGGRHARTNRFATALLEHLTPELLDDLHKKWKIDPASDKPWQKGLIGASNDYCGQYAGLTFTEVKTASTPDEFIEALRQRRGHPEGNHGSTISSAHSMYRVAFQYYQKNLQRKNLRSPDIVSLVLSRVLQPEARQKVSFGQWIALGFDLLKKIPPFGKKPSMIEQRLLKEFIVAYRMIPESEQLERVHPDDMQEFDRRLYSIADRIIGRVTYRMFSNAADQFARGNVGNAITFGAAILPLQAILGPYLYSYDKLNRDRKLLCDLEARFSPAIEVPAVRPRKKKIAWFSDTVTDVNGVSLTLHKMAAVAEQFDEDLEIVCSLPKDKAPQGSKFTNFLPVGEISIPDYKLQKLAMPPGMQMIRYLEEAGFSEYVISTPGPVGLLAMYAARILKVPCRAIYHSDFPQHVRHITGDEGLEQTTWGFMRWFYGMADAIYSPSQFYADQLADHGFDRKKLFIFHRGTDLEFFNPKHRDEKFFEPWGGSGKIVFVYTGRVSREKNLDTLIEAFIADEDLKAKGALAIVGDGPYLATLKERYNHPAVMFPGFVKGKDLAKAYASSDVFVFPSTTDTYGNSVLEAQASGLPAIVSDEGGPKEIIAPDKTGVVLPGYDVPAWTKAMRELLLNTDRRMQMASAARAHTATRDWTTAFREFWDDTPYSDMQLENKTVPLVS